MAYQPLPYGTPGHAFVPGIVANQSLATSQMQAALEQQQVLRVQLQEFWQKEMEEINNIGPTSTEFKTQQLPLTRIKKVSCTSSLSLVGLRMDSEHYSDPLLVVLPTGAELSNKGTSKEQVG
jgi:hypothetical protein